jgi:hypothetical protein
MAVTGPISHPASLFRYIRHRQRIGIVGMQNDRICFPLSLRQATIGWMHTMEVPLDPRLRHREGNLKLDGIVIRRVWKQVMEDMAWFEQFLAPRCRYG